MVDTVYDESRGVVKMDFGLGKVSFGIGHLCQDFGLAIDSRSGVYDFGKLFGEIARGYNDGWKKAGGRDIDDFVEPYDCSRCERSTVGGCAGDRGSWSEGVGRSYGVGLGSTDVRHNVNVGQAEVFDIGGGFGRGDSKFEGSGVCGDTLHSVDGRKEDFVETCGSRVRGLTSFCGEEKKNQKKEKIFPGNGVPGAFGKVDAKVPDVNVGGPNLERNRANRKAQKERKARRKEMNEDWRSRGGAFVDLELDARRALQASRAKLFQKQNEIAFVKAERDLQVMQAVDLDLEKKRNIARVRVATEKAMVDIEKAHATLKATDNVPRDIDHDVHTVFTDSASGTASGSISPNSSASMAEFRAVQKKNLDLEQKNKELLAALKKCGISEETLPHMDKELWTVDENGVMTTQNDRILDELCPEGYVIEPNYFEGVDNLKRRVIPL